MEQKKGRVSGRTMLLLLLMSTAACILIYNNYLFGDELLVFGDIGSDTKEQYMMWYEGIVNMIRSGGINAWDFHNGMGASIYNLNLFNPFLWTVYLVGTVFGPETMSGCMVYLLIVEILLAAQTCYLMLSCRTYSENAKLFASFMYAFSGYLLVWGQHYSLGGILALLPLLLMFVEQSMQRRLPLLGVSGMMGLIILNGYYQGYMTALGIGIYVTIRTLLYNEEKLIIRLKQFGTIAAAMASGLLIGMVNLLPSVMAVQASSRLDSNASMLEQLIANMRLWDYEYLRTFIYEFFGTNLQGAGNDYVGSRNYYEAPLMFFSVLFVTLLLQYIFTIHRRDLRLRQKCCHYLGIGICLFSVVVLSGSLPFNAFAYAFTRHIFLMLPFFAMISAWTLTQIFSKGGLFNRGALILSGLVMAAVYAKSYTNYIHPTYETNAMILGCCGIAAIVIIGLARYERMESGQAWILLSILLLISTVSDGGLTVRYRVTAKKSDTAYSVETHEGDTIEALAWIAGQDDGWYRVEKDYFTAARFMESMAQSYESVSTYNSTQTGGSLQFIRQLWPQLVIGYDQNHNVFLNSVHEDAMASLTGIKYLLSKEETAPADCYERIHQIGDVYIYRNKDVENPVQFFTKTLDSSQFQQEKETLDTWNLLTEVMITNGETASEDFDLDSYRKTEITEVMDMTVVDAEDISEDENGPVYHFMESGTLELNDEAFSSYDRIWAEFSVECEKTVPFTIRIGDDRAIEYANTDTMDHKLQLPADTKAITITSGESEEEFAVHNVRFYGTEEKAVSAASSAGEAAAVSVTRDEKTSTVSGTIDAAQDGYVMITIPYQDGWEVELDGENVEVMYGDYAFMAVPVSEGPHTFKASYHIPRYILSRNITIISILIWAAVWIICTVTARKNRSRGKH